MNYEGLKSYVKSACTSVFSENISVDKFNEEKERQGNDTPIVAFVLKCTFMDSGLDIEVYDRHTDGEEYLFFSKSELTSKDDVDVYKNLSRGDQLNLIQTIEEELVYQLDLYMVKPYIKDVQIFDDENRKIEHTESIIKVKDI